MRHLHPFSVFVLSYCVVALSIVAYDRFTSRK